MLNGNATDYHHHSHRHHRPRRFYKQLRVVREILQKKKKENKNVKWKKNTSNYLFELFFRIIIFFISTSNHTRN